MNRQLSLLCTLPLLAILSACGGSGGNSSSSSPQNAQINGYLTDYENLAKEGPSNLIGAGEIVSLAIYGQDLHDDLKIELGGKICQAQGDESYNNEEKDSIEEIMFIECPNQSLGIQDLKVYENGKQIYTVSLEAIDANTLALQQEAHLQSLRPNFDSTNSVTNARSTRAQTVSGGNLRDVTGKVTADRPKIETNVGKLAYDSGEIINFPVRGVLVELIDPATGKSIQTVATDSAGNYNFKNLETGQKFIVRVSAQLAKTRSKIVGSGPQYNFMVRNNAAGKYGESMPLYRLEKEFVVTEGAESVNLNASLGFNQNGELTDPAKRQSAPFAILDVLYNAVEGIEKSNPNITLKDLHIYWSANNRTIDNKSNQEKMAGKIKISHFQSDSEYPGLFILGEVNVDTDEFDRGVVGHEFGHYLQNASSYDASPGDDHKSGEFKDPSLSFSEGFGTAIGGLLGKSNYYTDSSGKNQQLGSSTDLNKIPEENNGFYSEDSIGYLLYQLGTNDAFGAFTSFWNTLTAMASGYESSTIFSFLDRFVAQSKASSTQILEVAKKVNIRSIDPLGVLPASETPDPKINQEASGGADDLEKIYIALNPQAVGQSKTNENLTPNATKFCFNSKLTGANKENGLGVSRRFNFKAPYKGVITYKLVDSTGSPYALNQFNLQVRDGSTGKDLTLSKSNGVESWNITTGTNYSVTIRLADSSPLLNGKNSCGNQFTLWNVVD